MGLAEKRTLRGLLVDRLSLELIGPSALDKERHSEVLHESPAQRYLAGVLWPGGAPIEDGDNEMFGTQDSNEDETVNETTFPFGQAMKPSSIGLSFLLDQQAATLRIEASWGTYVRLVEKDRPPVESSEASRNSDIPFENGTDPELPLPNPVEDQSVTVSAPEQESKETDSTTPEQKWQRIHHTMREVLDFSKHPGIRKKLASDHNISLEWISRPRDGLLAVTLFLVNRNTRPEKGKMDSLCIFQPELILSSADDANPFPFLSREALSNVELPYDPEILKDALLYRKYLEFAVGHGTAASWEPPSGDTARVGKIKTSIMPACETPRIIPPLWEYGGTMDMRKLADAKAPEELVDHLQPLHDAYLDWIDSQRAQVGLLPEDLRTQAEDHLRSCDDSCSRIQKGIDLLTDHDRPKVFEAFVFANKVMAEQRIHSLSAIACRRAGDWSTFPDRRIKTEWRPFQIAFILMALAGIVEPEHRDRETCDLLWFPTGGGKTEAYLGLTAFTLAMRRLENKPENALRSDAGVGVLMRYTLRLLTIQQFQRATALICACEVERKSNPAKWGSRPFRIGLWIGPSTPNTFDEAQSILLPRQANRHADPAGAGGDKTSPVQIVSCPWCGQEIQQRHYIASAPTRRVIVPCPRKGCDFHLSQGGEGIPAVVTDEEVYRLLPDLLIATVDKFARVPWVGESGSLFGKVSQESPKWGFIAPGASEETIRLAAGLDGMTGISKTKPLQPPDLIIQDELHLISGPLGTLAGLYETAVDRLSSRLVNGVLRGPKVIASTATIRRASDQVRLLFARGLSVFPPPAVDGGDSFFAVEQSLETTPGRIFLGIFAPGKSIKTTLVRVYAALLSAVVSIQAASSDRDPYMTLVGYFNSLRELGGAVRLIEDDIPSRIKTLASRKSDKSLKWEQRILNSGNEVPELTSRISPQDIPRILKELEQTFDSHAPGQPSPIDVIVASNMISVGVDVPRLGLMVVNGQPKTSSEYIQATSRIGREFPGLVVTVYNWSRPRDISHFERFLSYHSALYRYVEAISITPYSSRARDRVLPAVLAAMNRFATNDMAGDGSAAKFKSGSPVAKDNRDYITDRLTGTDTSRIEEVRKHIDHIYDRWHQCAMMGTLSYGKHNPKLLRHLGGADKGQFAAPDSMRDVEPSAATYIRE